MHIDLVSPLELTRSTLLLKLNNHSFNSCTQIIFKLYNFSLYKNEQEKRLTTGVCNQRYGTFNKNSAHYMMLITLVITHSY